MKRRACGLLLAALLLLPSPAWCGDLEGGEPFSDVAAEAWYHDGVLELYRLGLVNGRGDRFCPADPMAVCEALALASRLRSLHESGDSERGAAAYAGEGGAWYMPYVRHLQAAGAVGEELAEGYERPATRGELAHVLARALPEEGFEPRNRELVAAARASGRFMRDVGPDTDYASDIVLLYDWGVLGGTDGTGSFLPERSVSRCEVAAMAVRLAYEERRLTLDWDVPPPYAWPGEGMEDLVDSDGSFYEDPTPEEPEKIAADVRYMLSRGERSLTLQYGPGQLNSRLANELTQAFLYEARQYVEQTYNYVYSITNPHTGLLALEFASSLYGQEELERYRSETLRYALAVREGLWEAGALTEEMTEYEKARTYFAWVCENCRYDFAAVGADDSMSHSGWRVFAQSLAVCDGYTAAYNLLLKLEGIACGTYTLDSQNHIWTVAELDGEVYHIDTTWGDQAKEVAYRFFGMTEAEALARFPGDNG